MSARISKGDTVRCTHGEPDSGLFVGRNYEAKEVYVRSATGDAYIDVGVDPDGWRAERFEKVEPEHAEPEDKDDLYVEPEPLKESPRDVYPARPVRLTDRLGAILFDGMATVEWTSTGAIGTITPVKPAQCTSLWADPFATDPTTLRRCKFDAGHDERHRADWSAPTGHNQSATWADGGAYGRVEVSS